MNETFTTFDRSYMCHFDLIFSHSPWNNILDLNLVIRESAPCGVHLKTYHPSLVSTRRYILLNQRRVRCGTRSVKDEHLSKSSKIILSDTRFLCFQEGVLSGSCLENPYSPENASVRVLDVPQTIPPPNKTLTVAPEWRLG